MRVDLELFKQLKTIIYPLASFGIAQIGRRFKFLITLQANKAESFLSVVIYKNSSMPFWFRPNLTFSVRSSLSNYSLLA